MAKCRVACAHQNKWLVKNKWWADHTLRAKIVKSVQHNALLLELRDLNDGTTI